MFCAWCGSEVASTSFAPCPRCGKPTNGAQTVAPTSSSNAPVMLIVVIVGGLVAVAFIGILAAIAIPNFLTAKERAMQKRTMADMRMLATAVEAYATDNLSGYPQATSIEELGRLVSPKYIAHVPTVDAWRHPLMYSCTAEQEGRCTTYVIGSGGKDGMFEHSEPKEYVDSPAGTTSNFNCDIIFSNGSFIEYPEGAQP